MKIAIISDIHDNLENLYKFLDWCQQNKIERIICAGDVTNIETLDVLASKFFGDIYLVKGNAEIFTKEDVEKYKNINYLGEYGVFDLNNLKIGLCHEPFKIDKILEKGEVNYIFYGHTHKPWEEEREGMKIINPGALSGGRYKACFAAWETESGKIDLKILELL